MVIFNSYVSHNQRVIGILTASYFAMIPLQTSCAFLTLIIGSILEVESLLVHPIYRYYNYVDIYIL